ncbi:hypothetical protein B0H14DRAFT_3453817 [Mycena olivaceomarginata]|nr:hypothetical protein B0H14DRAFT_3453817 [Mycena olivaceomarginata]
MDLDALSPMYDAGGNVHYYVNEVARLKDGRFNGVVHADVLAIELDNEGRATVISTPSEIRVSVTNFASNFHDLEHANLIPHWTDATIKAGYPSPLSIILAMMFLEIASKAWNKHYNGYLTHRNLPHQLLQQEFHVHFISTSQNASIAEQYREFKARVEQINTYKSD